ncbi:MULTISPECIES: hypothetical protein [Lactobacillus]|uniref:Uncharacterized protein n=1 Tax=Lactobacillus crispatus TaxID=47770 RepID=A0A135YUY7_9LACO|nr:hypothetical protein [Lactobacillus crispatus]KWU13947.1 hypothetical protein AEM00_10280 [Lactobacillus crispatus]KXI13209.1 hypothetical protein HMPREF3209_02057 [Lactobacillus crispatus]MCT7697407.1 hypothetical protein [Lactobacillus crispatus]MCT7708797.1 hypothetical protein [Lactobacillus crispatus]TDN29268.1 hypothetical protein CEE75_11330 [Lactobacillus crispatus]
MKQNINSPKWNKEYQSCRLCLKLMEYHLEDELIKNLKHPANLVFVANIYRNCLLQPTFKHEGMNVLKLRNSVLSTDNDEIIKGCLTILKALTKLNFKLDSYTDKHLHNIRRTILKDWIDKMPNSKELFQSYNAQLHDYILQ